MPKVHQRTARQDIYTIGLRTRNTENKSGWSLERTKPADETDTILIHKGQKYYTWQIKGQQPQYSLTPPRRSQLTTSAYYQIIFDLQDADYPADESIFDEIDNIKTQLEDLLSETEDKLSNMPEGLQSGSTGELLQERIDAMSDVISQLESIDVDMDDEWDEEQRQQRYEEVVGELSDALSNL